MAAATGCGVAADAMAGRAEVVTAKPRAMATARRTTTGAMPWPTRERVRRRPWKTWLVASRAVSTQRRVATASAVAQQPTIRASAGDTGPALANRVHSPRTHQAPSARSQAAAANPSVTPISPVSSRRQPIFCQ